MYPTLISTDALARDRTDDWVVVDCRFDLKDDAWGLADYQRAHIPGAVYASLSQDLSSKGDGTNGRHPIPPVEVLSATFGRLGISAGTQVVAYDQDAGMYASRLWWSLRYLGHDAVAVLDGGWTTWTGEGRPTQAGGEARPRAVFVPAPRPAWRAHVEDVVALVAQPGRTLLIDARSAERFEGREEPLDARAGHIPGAANHFYRGNLAADGTMLAPDVLRANFQTLLGDRTPTEAVMYCGSGVTACQNLLAMAHAGMAGTRLYAGSWSEWSSDPSRPIETGAAGSKDPR
jgi:thiosulfate/3-mercaptopyruvate sulfurtransferase